MEYICMICGSRQHVLREGQVMLCTRCITALGIALGAKLEALHRTPHRHPERSASGVEGSQGMRAVRSLDKLGMTGFL